MAIPARIIRRRVRSVSSTRKIMKAMELVAAAKMRRATEAAVRSRPFAELIRTLTNQASHGQSVHQYPFLFGHPMVEGRKPRTMLIVAASDRGLCGGFNGQITKTAIAFLQARGEEVVSVVTVGRRAEQAMRRAGYSLVASFESLSNAPSFDRSLPITELVMQSFVDQSVDRVFVAYSHFKSALVQEPMVRQLLPVLTDEEIKAAEPTDADEQKAIEPHQNIFLEPSADQLLRSLLPRLIRSHMYQSLLEACASEQSARMMAMRNAQESAGDMLDALVSNLNRARQGAITREISEISAGRAAVEAR